ncbi:hypothetical protein [Streptomyces sp. NPDC048248]
MKTTGPALRATILVGENDTWQHKPLFPDAGEAIRCGRGEEER